MSKEDLVAVPRVVVHHEGRFHEIPRCWILIREGAEVEIWLSPRQDAPLLTMPLANVDIEWPSLEVTM